MRLNLLLPMILILSGSLFAKANVRSNSQSNFECSDFEKKRRECYLNGLGYKLYFTWEKVRLNNGVWRSVVEIPRAQKKSQWMSVRWFELQGRKFIEYKIWSEPVGEFKIESLIWSLVEVDGVVAKPKFSKVVQRRRPVADQPGKYHADLPERYGLFSEAAGKIGWRLGHQTGTL